MIHRYWIWWYSRWHHCLQYILRNMLLSVNGCNRYYKAIWYTQCWYQVAHLKYERGWGIMYHIKCYKLAFWMVYTVYIVCNIYCNKSYIKFNRSSPNSIKGTFTSHQLIMFWIVTCLLVSNISSFECKSIVLGGGRLNPQNQ